MYRRISIWLPLVLALAVLATPSSAGAQPLTNDQQKCADALNNGLIKVDKAVSKQIANCLKNHAKGKALSGTLGSINTLEACVAFDEKDKIATQADKVTQAFVKKCSGLGSGGAPKLPPYGPMSDVSVKLAGEQKGRALVHDAFGLNLDVGTLVTEAANKDGSKCQIAVMKAMFKCEATQLKEFRTCVKDGLKGKIPPGLITSAAAWRDLCLGVGTGGQPDLKGKIAKKCSDPEKGINKTMVKKCVEKGQSLTTLFPPCGSADPLATSLCLDGHVKCRVCQTINAADALDRDCDLFDDGIANGTCVGGGLPTPTPAATPVATVTPTGAVTATPTVGVPTVTATPTATATAVPTSTVTATVTPVPTATGTPGGTCGDGTREPTEECDSSAASAASACEMNGDTCRPVGQAGACTCEDSCGNGELDAFELCDNSVPYDVFCPGQCTSSCECPPSSAVFALPVVIDSTSSTVTTTDCSGVPSVSSLGGTGRVLCGEEDLGTGVRACRFEPNFGSFPAAFGLTGCFTKDVPGSCPVGHIDCDGGTKSDVVNVVDHDIASCTSNPDCAAQCAAHCVTAIGPSATVRASACEGFCQGGIGDGDACAAATDCPGGACPGAGTGHGNICNCDCEEIGGLVPVGTGDLQVNVSMGIEIEIAPPCGDGDVVLGVPPECAPFTTTNYDVGIESACAVPSGLIVASTTGSPGSCTDLAAGDATGLAIGGGTAALDFAGSDVALTLDIAFESMPSCADIVPELGSDCAIGTCPITGETCEAWVARPFPPTLICGCVAGTPCSQTSGPSCGGTCPGSSCVATPFGCQCL